MLGNLGFDALVGLVPVVGDLLDIGYKANRRNLRLLRRHFARVVFRRPADLAPLSWVASVGVR
jgi:hypothetical protein